MKKELIVANEPKSPISEAFRNLRTNLQFINRKEEAQTFLVTSPLPREGKSFVSANLSITFAQMGKRVILVDADMRKGRQNNMFEIKLTPGLSTYLFDYNDKEIKIQDYIHETTVKKLSMMPAGNVPPNPSELLVSDAMLNLIETLKKLYDVVIVDGPPTELVTDSVILSKIVDYTVIVSSSNETKKENVRKMIERIQNVGGKIAGIVVNKVQLKSLRESYYMERKN